MVKESVHKKTLSTLIDFSASNIELTSLARISAPKSSKRGIDCLLSGATRVLAAINLTSTFPFARFVRSFRRHRPYRKRPKSRESRDAEFRQRESSNIGESLFHLAD